MKCPKCHSKNKENVKFPEERGAQMVIKHPSGGALIPLAKKSSFPSNVSTAPLCLFIEFDELTHILRQ
jgi:hypothetical protein